MEEVVLATLEGLVEAIEYGEEPLVLQQGEWDTLVILWLGSYIGGGGEGSGGGKGGYEPTNSDPEPLDSEREEEDEEEQCYRIKCKCMENGDILKGLPLTLGRL